jgi:L-lactate dehydrogenase
LVKSGIIIVDYLGREKRNMKKGKVVLVGTGFVGMSMAYSMLNRGGIEELVLIDIDKNKTIGEEMDLSHGLPYAPQKMVIKAGDYSDCKDAGIVVITAGIAQKPGQTRLELAEVNTKIMKQITQSIMASGFNGIIVVASNPVDLMTYVVWKVSGLPKNKVIGSGTVLDTARLRYLVADYLKVSSKNVHAYIMGEHGDSSFVPWDHAYVGCKKIKDIMKDNKHPMEDLKKIHEGVVNAAYEIIEKKKATYYGIGMALNRLVRAIIDNENSILTVSTYLENQYGQDDIYIGVPAIINKNGVRELLELDLNDYEQEKLDNSCKLIKEMRKSSIDKIIEEN